MKKHKISNKLYYYSLEQNNQRFTNNQGTGTWTNTIEESIFSAILEDLQVNDEDHYVVDFSNVAKTTFKNEHYDQLINEKYVLLGLETKLFNAIKTKTEEKNRIFRFKEYRSDTNETLYLVYFNEDKDNFFITYLEKHICGTDDNGLIKVSLSRIMVASIIANILMEDIEYYDMSHLKYLESSNVYVNCYLNVKRIFLRMDVLTLTINQLKVMILQHFQSEDIRNVCLLGVSNNGIILSRILAYAMHMKVVSINHIGPKYCLNYDNHVMDQYKNQKYILVSDVICLGGEYRMTKGIISVLNSQLLGAVGIVKIREVFRAEEDDPNHIYAIIDNINEYGCNYQIYIDRKDKENG